MTDHTIYITKIHVHVIIHVFQQQYFQFFVNNFTFTNHINIYGLKSCSIVCCKKLAGFCGGTGSYQVIRSLDVIGLVFQSEEGSRGNLSPSGDK
jgi:hypothetical protein